MMKYFIGGEFDSSEVEIETSLPDNYELELGLLLSTIKESKDSAVFNVSVGGSVTARPRIYRGRVYFGACDRNVYALDFVTGQEIWRFSTGGPVVICVAFDQDRIYSGSYDGNLYCLDLEGRLVWKYPLGDKIAFSPAVHKGVIYSGCRDGNVYAINRNGTLRWRFSTGGPTTRAVIHKDRCYVGSFDHNLYCLDLEGRLVWKFPAGGLVGEPVASGDAVYFGSFDHSVYAVNLNGRLIWKFRTADKIPMGSYLAVHGDTVFFGSRDYNFYAVRNGRLVWKFKTGNMVFTRPLIDRGVVYFTSADSNLYAADIRTGRELWRLPIQGVPLYLDKCGDIITFGTHDCNVYAINTEREVVWKFHTSLDYPSTLEDTTRVEYTLTVPVYDSQKKKVEKKGASQELGSYGDFRCNYIGGDMRDYIGTEIKDGLPGMAYKAGKKVYRK